MSFKSHELSALIAEARLDFILKLRAKGSYEFFASQAKALSDARRIKSSFLFDRARRA